jgi:Fic family protein
MAKIKITPFKPLAFPPRRLKRKTLIPLLREANAALKQLKAVPTLKKINPSILKQEAIDSLESQKNHDAFTTQAKAYLKALQFASHEITHASFSKKILCETHYILKKPARKGYRKKQNWIGPEGHPIEDAYFFPPAPQEVAPLMSKLLNYMQKDTQEPLLQLALIFAQFLIIHPFMDGNGRIARICVPLFLYKKGLLPTPSLFLSTYFKKHRLKYFQTLFSITHENNWEDWIEFFLKGIIQTAKSPGKFLPRGFK